MMFGDARDRLTFFRLQLRASERERERERGELCTIMEKDVGKPQVFCCNLFCTHSLLGCIEVVGSGSSRTASLTSAGNSRLLGSVGRL